MSTSVEVAVGLPRRRTSPVLEFLRSSEPNSTALGISALGYLRDLVLSSPPEKRVRERVVRQARRVLVKLLPMVPYLNANEILRLMIDGLFINLKLAPECEDLFCELLEELPDRPLADVALVPGIPAVIPSKGENLGALALEIVAARLGELTFEEGELLAECCSIWSDLPPKYVTPFLQRMSSLIDPARISTMAVTGLLAMALNAKSPVLALGNKLYQAIELRDEEYRDDHLSVCLVALAELWPETRHFARSFDGKLARRLKLKNWHLGVALLDTMASESPQLTQLANAIARQVGDGVKTITVNKESVERFGEPLARLVKHCFIFGIENAAFVRAIVAGPASFTALVKARPDVLPSLVGLAVLSDPALARNMLICAFLAPVNWWGYSGAEFSLLVLSVMATGLDKFCPPAFRRRRKSWLKGSENLRVTISDRQRQLHELLESAGYTVVIEANLLGIRVDLLVQRPNPHPVVVEVDGEQYHRVGANYESQRGYDILRDRALVSLGYRVIRIDAREVSQFAKPGGLDALRRLIV